VAKRTSKNRSRFDIAKYLETAGVRRSIANYRKGQTIFSQGDDCTTVLYLQQGTVS
jgi:CRP-like cAMP-binding protein